MDPMNTIVAKNIKRLREEKKLSALRKLRRARELR